MILSGLQSRMRNLARIRSVCTVFAQPQVIRSLGKGVPKPDIAAGIYKATVDRVVTLLKRAGIGPESVISGGIGNNIGVVKRIEAMLEIPARIPPEPQIMGVPVAPLFAGETVR